MGSNLLRDSHVSPKPEVKQLDWGIRIPGLPAYGKYLLKKTFLKYGGLGFRVQGLGFWALGLCVGLSTLESLGSPSKSYPLFSGWRKSGGESYSRHSNCKPPGLQGCESLGCIGFMV